MQPTSGYQWYVIGTGVGTTVVSNRSTNLGAVLVPGTYTGTMAVYDSATIAGTAAGNLVATFTLPANSFPQCFNPNLQFKNKIVCTCTGTPLMTFGIN